MSQTWYHVSFVIADVYSNERAVVQYERSSPRSFLGPVALRIREELASDLGIESAGTEDFLDVCLGGREAPKAPHFGSKRGPNATKAAFWSRRYPGAVFRLRIFHPQEMAQTAQKLTEPSSSPVVGCEKGSVPLEMLSRLRQLWWTPRVYSALHALALRHPPAAGAARVLKRWMSSQTLEAVGAKTSLVTYRNAYRCYRCIYYVTCYIYIH